LNVLIVDDHESNAQPLAELLRQEGHSAEVCLTGLEVVNRLASPPPDAVLLDYVLPGMDGLAVLREMRRHEGWRAVPVVMTTAMPEAYLLGHLKPDDHPVGVLPKPFELAALLAALAAAEARKGG
jgi:two-component system, OmpR family, phosphate regulon response regulator PhoB